MGLMLGKLEIALHAILLLFAFLFVWFLITSAISGCDHTPGDATHEIGLLFYTSGFV